MVHFFQDPGPPRGQMSAPVRERLFFFEVSAACWGCFLHPPSVELFWFGFICFDFFHFLQSWIYKRTGSFPNPAFPYVHVKLTDANCTPLTGLQLDLVVISEDSVFADEKSFVFLFSAELKGLCCEFERAVHGSCWTPHSGTN